MGRMVLTQCILQSILMILLLMWFGLGLWGQLTLVQVMGLVSVLYALQVASSVVWMRYFTYGPLEYCWRWWTYGRRPRRLP